MLKFKWFNMRREASVDEAASMQGKHIMFWFLQVTILYIDYIERRSLVLF